MARRRFDQKAVSGGPPRRREPYPSGAGAVQVHSSAAQVLDLQQKAGNRAVTTAVQRLIDPVMPITGSQFGQGDPRRRPRLPTRRTTEPPVSDTESAEEPGPSMEGDTSDVDGLKRLQDAARSDYGAKPWEVAEEAETAEGRRFTSQQIERGLKQYVKDALSKVTGQSRSAIGRKIRAEMGEIVEKALSKPVFQRAATELAAMGEVEEGAVGVEVLSGGAATPVVGVVEVLEGLAGAEIGAEMALAIASAVGDVLGPFAMRVAASLI